MTARPGTIDPDYAIRIMDGLENANRIVDGQTGLRADFARRQITLAAKVMDIADAVVTGDPGLSAILHRAVGDAWGVKP